MESKFSDLRPEMQARLRAKGIEELFAVQKYTYKLFIEGFELIVKSKTGSGKTLAFLLPLEELIAQDSETAPPNNNIKAIILEPTRELAIQVKAMIDKFSGLSCELVYGGADSSGQ
jgi:superfamily II DNA/RNA helicase